MGEPYNLFFQIIFIHQHKLHIYGHYNAPLDSSFGSSVLRFVQLSNNLFMFLHGNRLDKVHLELYSLIQLITHLVRTYFMAKILGDNDDFNYVLNVDFPSTTIDISQDSDYFNYLVTTFDILIETNDRVTYKEYPSLLKLEELM